MWLRMVYKLNNINQVDILTTSKVDMQLPFFIFHKKTTK